MKKYCGGLNFRALMKGKQTNHTSWCHASTEGISEKIADKFDHRYDDSYREPFLMGLKTVEPPLPDCCSAQLN